LETLDIWESLWKVKREMLLLNIRELCLNWKTLPLIWKNISFTSLGANMPINETFYKKMYSRWLKELSDNAKDKGIITESDGYIW
jgi:hypothetical protein